MSFRPLCSTRFLAILLGMIFGYFIIKNIPNINIVSNLKDSHLLTNTPNQISSTVPVPARCRPYLRHFRRVLPPIQAFPGAGKCPRWKSWVKVVRKCVLTELKNMDPELIWYDLTKIVDCCTSTLRKLLSMLMLIGKDDIKYIIFPTDLNEPCRAVSLGIGGDTLVESKLHQVLPQCELYGADPDSKMAGNFKYLGEFHNVAIAGKSGPKQVSLLENGTYVKKTKKVIALDEYLDEVINQNEIDFLFMDIEGSEYSIMEEFFNNGSLAEGNSKEIEICHMTVELHGPLENYNMSPTKYGKLLVEFFTNTGFVPLWAPPASYHQRLFVSNLHSKYCIERYFYQWCQNPAPHVRPNDII